MATQPSVPSSSPSSSDHHSLPRQHTATTPPPSPSRSAHDTPTQYSQQQQQQQDRQQQSTSSVHRSRPRHNTISSTHSSSSTLSKSPFKFARLLHLQPSATYAGSGSTTVGGSGSSSHSKRLNEPASPRAQQKQPQQQQQQQQQEQQQPHRHHYHHHSHHLHAAAAKFREKVQQRGGFLSFLQSHYHTFHSNNNNSHHRDRQSSPTTTSPADKVNSSMLREPSIATASSSRSTLNDGERAGSGEQQQQQHQQHQSCSDEPGGALLQPIGPSANQSLGNDQQQLPPGAHLTASPFLSIPSAHHLQPTSSSHERDHAIAGNNTRSEADPYCGRSDDLNEGSWPSLSSSRSWTRRPSTSTMLSSPPSTLSPPVSSPVSPESPAHPFMTIQSVKQLPPLPHSTSSANLPTKNTISSHLQPHSTYNLTISDFRVAQHLQRNLAANNHQPDDTSHPQHQQHLPKKPHSNRRLHQKSSLPSLTLTTKVANRFSERRDVMGNCISDSNNNSSSSSSINNSNHSRNKDISSLSPSPSSLFPHTPLPSSPHRSPKTASASASPTTLSTPLLPLDHAHYKASLYELAQSRLDVVSPRSHLPLHHQSNQQTEMHRGEANGQYPLKDSQGETYYQETREGRRDQAAGDWASVNRNGKPHEIDSNSVEQRRPTSTTTDTAGARRTSAQHSREDDAASVPASPSSVTAALKSLKKKPSMLLSFLKRRPSPAATSSVPVPAHYLSLPIGGTITLSPSMPTTPNGGVYSLCSEDLSSSEFAKLAGITILPDIDDEMEDYNYEDSMQGQKTSISWQMPSSSSSNHHLLHQGPGGSSSSTGTGHRGVSGLGLGAAGSASASIHRTLLSNASTTGGVSSSGLSSTTATGGILDRERNATNYSLASDSSRRKVNIWDPLFWTTPNKDSPVMVTTTAAESSNDAQVEGAGDNSQQRQQRTSNNSSSTNTVESPSVSATSYFPAMPGTTTAVTPLPMRIVTRERSATMIQLSGSAPMSRPLQPSGHFSRVHASSPSPPLPSPLGAKQHQLHSQHGMPVSSSASSRRHSSAVSPMSGSMSPSSPPTPTIIHRQMAYASSGANQLSPTASAPPSPTSAMPLSPFAMAPAVAEELQQVRRRPSSLRLQGIANGGGGSGKDSPAVPTTAATSAVLLPHHVPGRRKSFSSLTALAIELDHETTEDQSAAVATAVTEFSAPANGTSSDGDAAAAVRIKVVNPTPPAMSDAYFERRVHPLSPLTAVFPNGGDEMHGEHGSGSSDSGGSGMVRQQSSHGRLEGVRGSRFQPVYSSSSSSSASTRSSSRSRSRSRSRSPTPSANMTGKRLSPLSKEYDPNGSGGSSSNGGHLHHHQHGHHSHHHHHHHHHHHPLRPSNSRSHNGHSRFELCTADGTSLTDLKAAGRGGDRLSPLSATSDNRAIAVNNPHQHHHHHHHRSSLQHANSASGVSGVRRFSHQNHLSPVSAYNSSTGGSISSSTSSSSNSSSSSGGSSGGDTLSPTATTKSTTKGPTARFPSSHQRTLSLPSSPLPPIPVPISYASSSSSSAMAPSGYHRGSEMLSSSYQERSILSSCASSRHLHPFDQPLPSPGPLQSPSTPTARAPLPPPFAPSSAPSSSSSSSTKSSLEPRHFTPGTKVGRFTLVEDKGTTGVDVMEASRLRRGSQLSTLSQYSSTGTAAATATMDVGLGVASSSPPSSNSGGDHLHHHELLIMRAGIDHQHHPMRRPSSSLSNASSTYNMDGSIASDHQHHQHFGRTKTTLDSSDDHQQGEGGGGGEGGLLDDDENEERGGRVVVDTEENCLVFQRKKKRGHPKRRVPATCSFTATAAATSAESPFSLQAQMQQQQQQSPPLLSPPHSHPQLHHRRPMDQMSSSLPTSFLLPSGDMMANGGHGGGGGGLVGSSSDEFAPSSHP